MTFHHDCKAIALISSLGFKIVAQNNTSPIQGFQSHDYQILIPTRDFLFPPVSGV